MTYIPCGCKGWAWMLNDMPENKFRIITMLNFKTWAERQTPVLIASQTNKAEMQYCPFCGQMVNDGEYAKEVKEDGIQTD